MVQKFDVFFNFDGDCMGAIQFYEEVFHSQVKDLMRYSDTPANTGYEMPEADKDRIMYACVPIFGCNVMLCDVPSGSDFVRGNNIAPTLGTDDKAEIERLYQALKDGGEVLMELAPTFFSGLFAMVQDKYGIIWQLSHFGEA